MKQDNIVNKVYSPEIGLKILNFCNLGLNKDEIGLTF
jgi:hypothetical protein